ncbi:MAG: hypothetical protein Q9160_007541 [Pyrenula sp. 1 TL-2023]
MDGLEQLDLRQGLLSEEYELQQTENNSLRTTTSAYFTSQFPDRRSRRSLFTALPRTWRITGQLISNLAQSIPSPLSFGRRRRRTFDETSRFESPSVATINDLCSSRRLLGLAKIIMVLVLAIQILAGIFWPSYTRPPERYRALDQAIMRTGRGNANTEKVFIAAAITDSNGDLVGGDWGRNLVSLINILGPENCYLSIYANGGRGGKKALDVLRQKVDCDNKIVFEEHVDLSQLPHIVLPDGSKRIKRLALLAEVRNRALRPLASLSTQFDKLLYVNDVVFRPVDAVNLLFSTHVDTNGRAHYRAACAVDFINPFKFYDTFASRDLEGYSMGIPFYPWFSNSGKGESRKDVLQQTDAVRVRSCWGGMVAFDARFFQPSSRSLTADLVNRFRVSTDLFWDASECCLIMADIQIVPSREWRDSGIYMNPYIRVAYDSRTLSWLGFTRRFERSYSLIHNILNHLVGLPWFNPRRMESAGEIIQDSVWTSPSSSGNEDQSKSENGSFEKIERVADPGGFCGRRKLFVLRIDRKEGEKYYEPVPVPPD